MSDPQWWLLDDLVLARSAIDRAAERRSDQAWVEGARIDPSSRFVRVHQAPRPSTGIDSPSMLRFPSMSRRRCWGSTTTESLISARTTTRPPR